MLEAGVLAKKLDGRGGSRNAGRKSDDERESDVYRAYNEARAKREMHNARIAEFEEERIAGSLLNAEEMTKAAEQVVTNFRARMLAVPVKVAPLCAGLSSTARIEAIIRKSIEDALQELSDLGRV